MNETDNSIDTAVTQQQEATAARRIPENDIRMNLLKKHSTTARREYSTLESELSRFTNITDAVPDVLVFWRAEQKSYPQLAQIARAILCKPATSAKSESAFSIAGALLTKKRANLDSLRSQKILFIHDNYPFLKSFSDFNF